MAATTYRCAACGQDLKVEEIEIANAVNVVRVVEVTPCEICLTAAEEAVKDDSFEDGYRDGWQAGYDSCVEEEEEEEDTGV